MGLTPFACIPKQNDLHHFVRVVYPDGRIENLTRSCSVDELLQGNPDHFVCGSSAHTITSRMGTHEHLEKGFTYFVCAEPNAQPFLESHPKRTSLHRAAAAAGRRISPRFSRHGLLPGREIRSPTHHGKVFDFHSASMQVEGMRIAVAEHHHHHLRPPKHLRLVFFRYCLQQALRLPRNFSSPNEPLDSGSSADESIAPPSLDPKDAELVDALLRSAARSELGIYVARRQEFYLRRARMRRKTVWKPVLQSISETTPVVEFLPPKPESSSPPRPSKSSSPPRPLAPRGPPRNISPPRHAHINNNSPRIPSPPPPLPPQQQQRKSSNQRALYVA